ncbi:Para-aminobenzoate synthase, aminase component [Candidatus Syntrophocurvum alkaliphilum]|uniref:Anthranilate synthase component 1 n=1 Tax=Candidatus Syntrophocurvum alkaliphilum TaxID=2293317 RepID=A0A6I6DIP0_9FIRM|nr:aminodeoxychorismate synthase component I [Candidatus Syntrophocurvum alkaliphilum]QGU00549.1 Para-aminobenzoate synthase, aminase component [Candidatus Syntrophocurvum alkaliphilum]
MYINEIRLDIDLWDLYKNIKEVTSFILDSSLYDIELGRYTFMGLNPDVVFRSKGNKLEYFEKGTKTAWEGDPLDALNNIVKNISHTTENLTCPFPFKGGLVGYISYDLKNQIEKLPQTAEDDLNLYDQYWGIYYSFLVKDHTTKKTYIVSYDKKKADTLLKKINQFNIKTNSNYWCYIGDLKSNFTRDDYIKAVKQAKEHIRIGDIYQVNLSQRFSFDIEGSSKLFYDFLRKTSPSYFGTFLNFSEYSIMSISPERFIKTTENTIETRPIKGTRGRGENYNEDSKIKKELVNSKKDRAELLMIVDLMRNDIGKITQPGTVKVYDLFKVSTYATLFHLDAIVTGTLKPENNNYKDILKATFPGGSITGAPKIKSMEIIDELEPTTRGVYTGSIGYIGFNQECDLNIAIRTAVIKNGKGYYYAGGGIVSDSNPDLEYEETWVKTKALVKAKEEANKSANMAKWNISR